MKFMTLLFSLFACSVTYADNSSTIEAVKSSPMIQAVKLGAQAEQSLDCDFTTDENGDLTIQFITENHRSKFVAQLLCSNGKSYIVKGIIGDGGQTVTEKIELTSAN